MIKKLVCPVCEKVFYFDRIISGRTPKYCSQDCKRQRNREYVLEKYYRNKFDPHTRYSREFMAKYELRHKPCIRCGFSDIVVLHDIIPAIEGGDRSDPCNRIPLCPNCHATLHRNFWKIWEIEDKLYNDPRYYYQYWFVQILKSDNHSYTHKRRNKRRIKYDHSEYHL